MAWKTSFILNCLWTQLKSSKNLPIYPFNFVGHIKQHRYINILMSYLCHEIILNRVSCNRSLFFYWILLPSNSFFQVRDLSVPDLPDPCQLNGPSLRTAFQVRPHSQTLRRQRPRRRPCLSKAAHRSVSTGWPCNDNVSATSTEQICCHFQVKLESTWCDHFGFGKKQYW